MKDGLPEDVEQVLLGSMFGDGWLVKRCKNSIPKFAEGHSIKQKAYLLWKKEVLNKEFVMKSKIHKNGQIHIHSLISPKLKEYYPYFYPTGKGRKVFTLEMLNKLKPLGLAVWYMDDGCFMKASSFSIIALHKQNKEIVKRWFKTTFNINSRVQNLNKSNGVQIILNKENTRKFFRIIHSYIHPSMRYKIKRTREELLTIRRKNREYNQTPKRKKYNKEYQQRPEVKAKQREYWQRPEVKKRAREYMRKKLNIPPEKWRIK